MCVGLFDTSEAARKDREEAEDAPTSRKEGSGVRNSLKALRSKTSSHDQDNEELPTWKTMLIAVLQAVIANAVMKQKAGKPMKIRKLMKKMGGKKFIKLLDKEVAKLVTDKQSRKLVRKLVGKKQLRRIGATKLAKKVA